jgi:ferredoxin--NADP+ reductase
MLERLPTPWGLVRSGVAPDHPKIKSVTRVYEKTAAHPRFRFFGNVTFGEHVSREDLLAHYHAIVYATGSPSTARSASPAKISPARTRRPSSSAGTTATPTTPTSSSTCSRPSAPS